MKNKKLMLALADMIESKPDESIDMNNVINECGTVGCILGWGYHDGIIKGYNFNQKTGLFNNGKKGEPGKLLDFEDLAVELFDIPLTHAYQIFSQSDILPNDAKSLAHRLRQFVKSNGKDFGDYKNYFLESIGVKQ